MHQTRPIQHSSENNFVVLKVPHIVASAVREMFLVSFISYVFFALLDRLVPGFVTRVFNVNILLGTTLVLGILVIWWFDRTATEKDEKYTSKFISFLPLVVGCISGIVVWLQTGKLGWIALPLAIFSMLIVACVTWFLLDSDVFLDQYSSEE